MYTSWGNLTLKETWQMLKFWEGIITEDKATAHRLEVIKELKKAIRDYNNRSTDRRCVKGDWDGYIMLIEFPDYIETKEDAEEHFHECEELRYHWSPYDCTGQHFTSWYKLFKRNGRWMCYHSIGVDV